MANAPLAGRDGKSCSPICISEKQKYFSKGDWTSHNWTAGGGEVICPTGGVLHPLRDCRILAAFRPAPKGSTALLIDDRLALRYTTGQRPPMEEYRCHFTEA
jgi:hypothetical protein